MSYDGSIGTPTIWGHRLLAALIVLLPWLALSLAGCSQLAMAPDSDWTRSWVRPVDQVWEIALEVLTDQGFVIERKDHDAGTIRAEAPGRHEQQRPVLHISIEDRDGTTRVEVGISGSSGSPGDIMRFDETVAGFLDDLDRALRETA